MQKTPRELAADFEAELIEFDRVMKRLGIPVDQKPVDDEAPSAQIIWLNDYRGVLH